ncbi:MAG: TIGR03086 family metal-binding protein [Nocardioides sp.]
MSYTKTVTLPVSPDEAFALITEPERLRRWQTVSATVDLRAGGSYRWTVTPGHVAAGTYREVEPGKRVVFGWGWDGSPDLAPDTSTVTVTVEPTEGGSRVTLVHEGLDEQQAKAHAEGWDHFFGRLEKLATEGDAGPDSWSWAPENLDPLVAAEAALAAFQPVLRALSAEDRPKQTPCSDFTCHDLAEHLFVSLKQLGALAGAEVVRPDQDSLENRISVMADQAITGWRARGLEGSVPGPGGGEMPASFAASILPVELLLHAWDMAQGSGQVLRVSDEVVEYVAGLAEGVIPGGRGRSFHDEVLPAADAGALERLAAYAGRTPVA